MQYIIPHYYKKFACIGGDCPDTCCAGWQIMICLLYTSDAADD